MIPLSKIKEVTGHDAVASFVEDNLLPDTDWNLVKIRRKSVRLEPPHAYWASYRVVLGRGDLVFPEPDEDPVLESSETADRAADASPPSGAPETGGRSGADEVASGSELAQPTWSDQRELRLVARGVFDSDYWKGFRERVVARGEGRRCDPLNDLGWPVVFDETQHVFWLYPFDPNLPGLVRAADPEAMRRIFQNHKQKIVYGRGNVLEVKVELARYLPEIACILRYDAVTDHGDEPVTVYGKVQNGNRGAESHRVMEELWRTAEASGGLLRVPKPLGYYPELGLYLQSSVPGTVLDSDRTKPEFRAGMVFAAEALAATHRSGIPTLQNHPLENEIARLDKVVDQFALVHPRGYFLLREFVQHVRDKLRKLPAEEQLPTHGDYKYDQLLHDGEQFSLIDFDFFAMAETSFDLGKFAAYVIPSMPKSWEQSVAAEENRKVFLDRYRELRPEATLQRFPVYESVNLAGRAMTLMWSQTRDWKITAESLLALAMERLNSRLP